MNTASAAATKKGKRSRRHLQRVLLLAGIGALASAEPAAAHDSGLDRNFGGSGGRGRAIVAFDLADGVKRDVGHAIFANGDAYLVAGRIEPSTNDLSVVAFNLAQIWQKCSEQK